MQDLENDGPNRRYGKYKSILRATTEVVFDPTTKLCQTACSNAETKVRKMDDEDNHSNTSYTTMNACAQKPTY